MSHKNLSPKKNSLGEKLISNTTYLFVDWLALSFFSFLFWMILSKTPQFQRSDVGIVSTSINFVIFVSGISSLGIYDALRKLIPEIKKRKGFDAVHSLVKLSIKPFIISLAISSFLLIIFLNQLSAFIKIPFYAFAVLIPSIIICSFFAFFGAVLYGLQNMKLFSLTDFLMAVFKLISTWIFILIGISYFKEYLYLAPIIGFTLSHFLVLFLRMNLSFLKAGKSISYKKLFSYTFPSFISIIAIALVSNGQYIILTILKNAEITGIYTVAFTITSVIGVLTHMPSSALFPIISSLSADKKTKKKQGYLIGLTLRYSLFFIIPLSVLILIFSKEVILLYSSPQFLPAMKYFPTLIPASILYGLGVIFLYNLYSTGKPKLLRNIMISTAVSFFIISLIFTNYFPEASGLSLSYLIVMLSQCLLSFYYMNKFIKPSLFAKDLLKIFLSSFIILLTLSFIRPFVHDILTLTIILIPTSLIYLGILFFTKFYRIEDVRILRYLGKRIPSVEKYIASIANFLEKKIKIK